MEAFTSTAQRVKVHLAYARVFDDALTEDDLVAACDPDDPEGVRRVLHTLEAEGLIERSGKYCFLAGEATDDHMAVAAERRRTADAILAANRPVLERLGAIPWVRHLSVSGSLARGNPRPVPGKPVDLDLFVITAPASVYIVRLIGRITTNLRTLFAWLRGARPPVRLCFNYMTESSYPNIGNTSLFTASDALHVVVIEGAEELARFLSANPWISDYYPVELDPANQPDRDESAPTARVVLNTMCFLVMAVAQWFKRPFSGRPFLYSFEPRPGRPHNIRRVAPAGGGLQPQVARRFMEIYMKHFGRDDALGDFLFPGTTNTGVYLDGVHHASTTPPSFR